MSFSYNKATSRRLKNYDYSREGMYFVTIKCKYKRPLFGKVVDGQMQLNTFGKIAHQAWTETPLIRPQVGLGAFVVMPDHMHGILSINQYLGHRNRPRIGKFISPTQTIGAMVRGYKGVVTKRIRAQLQAMDINLLSELDTPLIATLIDGAAIWQDNYHDWVIKNPLMFMNISNYILNNPQNYYNKPIL